jgi:hypothetical protein
MFSFDLATADEIGLELAKRLRSHRLAQNLGQTELVQNLEAKGQASLESLLKIVTALGLAGSLSELFVLRPTSIKEMETTSAGRMRATGAGR